MKSIFDFGLSIVEYFVMDFSVIVGLFLAVTLVVGITLVFRLAFPWFDHEDKVKKYVESLGGYAVLGTYLFTSSVGLVICTLITLSLKSHLM